MWDPHVQTHMGHNGNHMGPNLDLAKVAHVLPTFVESISDLILYILVLISI